MKTIHIDIERNGIMTSIGAITGSDARDAVFTYDKTYLGRADAVPVSISLPLTDKSFTAEATENFFSGLLPEGFMRRSVAGYMGVKEDDYLSLLAALGDECIGAIRVTTGEERSGESGYVRLSEKEISDIAREGISVTTEFVAKSHLSLTGASGKAGLYYDEKNGDWYLPVGDAPSTHIVKQSHVRLGAIVTNEQLCLRAASLLGIETADSFIINRGKGTDGDVLFATRRYDRILSDEQQIDGLPKPLRLHQEDFAQALGIPAQRKYEQNGDNYLRRVCDVIRAHSMYPLEDMLKIWDITVFNYLVGNTDNHIKNISLLYTGGLNVVRLAPAYDIVSTAVYDSSTRDMSMSVDGKYSLDEITKRSFINEAEIIGLGKGVAEDRLDRMCNGFEKAVSEAAYELKAEGFFQAGEIKEKIIKNGGYAKITEEL